MKIDLAHLKHRELPTKEVKVEINGEEQSITIKPINGRGFTSFGLISEDDVDAASKRCLIALMYGLQLTQDEAELFMINETFAADMLAAEIINFTRDYQIELSKANEEVKKNIKRKITK